ncbi:MFS transporter [Paracoccus aerodenitrificans]|uniref:MFS transporter n=1 Tax=Paracoccus aerodenitrificans TaxID=3017781 RepID=UPI0022F0363D|nr:MFS transporter [Paracoccus aerodenitrificans]WBU64286.1 MFS transporter [Paracoccus aerodenitrificans]
MSELQSCISAEIESDGKAHTGPESSMPMVVYFLGLTCFMLGTSEFMVAGMMPALAQAFGVTVAEVGNLISLYAAGMVIGGPILTVLLLRFGVPNKAALLLLLGFYIGGSAIAAGTSSYDVMAAARVLTGVAASACFGVSISIAADLVASDQRGRASSLVLAGLMLATVLGVPAATLIEQNFGWRISFRVIVVLATLCATVIAFLAPGSKKASVDGAQLPNLPSELASFRNARLWAAFATSGLIIGATFAAFSYFSPIFTEITGFSSALIPVLLAAFGTATVIGNLLIGRYADRYIFPILTGGLAVLSVALLLFAVFADDAIISIAAFVAIGFAGLPMNPAMVARVMRAVPAGPLVNTVHVSVINIGLAFGTWAGGLGIKAGYGLTSPLWIGFGLAVLGLASLAPVKARRLS